MQNSNKGAYNAEDAADEFSIVLSDQSINIPQEKNNNGLGGELWYNHGSLARWFAINILKFNLFYCNYDLFSVYRAENHKNHHLHNYGIYKSIIIEKTKQDFLKEKVHKILRMFLIYYVIKNSIISIIQYTVTIQDSKHNEIYRVKTHAITSKVMTVNRVRQTANSTNDLILIRELSHLIGNPLSELADVSLIYYFCLAFAITVYTTFGSYQFSGKNLFDFADLRFSQIPKFELKRIDLIIEDKLRELLTSAEFYKLRLIEKLNNRVRGNRVKFENESIVWLQLEASRVQLLELIVERKYNQLRPANFEKKWREQVCLDLTSITLIFYSLNTLWFLVTLYLLLPLVVRGKCELLKLKSDDCNIITALNVREKYYLGEVIFALTTLLMSFTFHIVLHAILAKSQLNLINGMQSDLNTCLTKLRHISEEGVARSHSLVIHNHNKTISIINKLLLETLIKIFIALIELKKSSRSMTSITTIFVVNTINLVVISSVSASIVTEDSKLTRESVTVVNWIFGNSFALGCAFIFARITQIERLYWSILAEISRIISLYKPEEEVYMNDLNRKQTVNDFRTTYSNFTIALWRKFVFSSNSVRNEYSARPFNINLTYQKTIEINFLIISLYSLFMIL